MMTNWTFIEKNRMTLCWMALLTLALACASSATAADKIDFGKDVYPILSNHCLSCHGAPYVEADSGRTKKPKAGLRLDTHASIMKGYDDDGKQVAVVVPGKPEESTFFTSTALNPDHDDIMPATGDPLTRTQQEILKQWIAQGAQSNGFQEPIYVNSKAKK